MHLTSITSPYHRCTVRTWCTAKCHFRWSQPRRITSLNRYTENLNSNNSFWNDEIKFVFLIQWAAFHFFPLENRFSICWNKWFWRSLIIFSKFLSAYFLRAKGMANTFDSFMYAHYKYLLEFLSSLKLVECLRSGTIWSEVSAILNFYL